MSYRFLKISSFNKSVLADYYANNLEILFRNYTEQYVHLMQQRISLSDFYQTHLQNKGVEAFEVVANAEHLQKTWAKENALNNTLNIVEEQIKFYKPDVIFFQDSVNYNGTFIKELKSKFPFIKLLIGFSCSPYNGSIFENFKHFDFIITCSNQFKNAFISNGIKAYTIHHGFEPSILNEIKASELTKIYDFVFIGSILPGKGFHKTRLDIIEKLLEENINLKIFGDLYQEKSSKIVSMKIAYNLAELLRKIGFKNPPLNTNLLKKSYTIASKPEFINYSEKLKKSVSKMVYGTEMFNQLAQSKIGFNMHGEIAQSTANMRVFETTGVGTCLLTDYKNDIRDFFEPDFEVVTYTNANECVEKVNWLLNNPLKTNEIAKKGQERCIKNHSMENRVSLFNEIVLSNLNSK